MAEVARAAKTKSPDGRNSKYLTDAPSIRAALVMLRDQRCTLQLRFDGVTQTYTAKILEVTNRDLLLEDVQPRDGFAHLRAGVNFSLAAREQGAYIFSSTNRAHDEDAERGVPYFCVRHPVEMLHQQRRKNSRISIPMRVSARGADIILFRNEGELKGRLVDISAGGCRVEFAAPPEPALRQGENIPNTLVNIRELLQIHSEVIVRHASFDKRKGCTVCGLEFHAMHVTDRRRLEQYVQTLARAPRIHRPT